MGSKRFEPDGDVVVESSLQRTSHSANRPARLCDCAGPQDQERHVRPSRWSNRCTTAVTAALDAGSQGSIPPTATPSPSTIAIGAAPSALSRSRTSKSLSSEATSTGPRTLSAMPRARRPLTRSTVSAVPNDGSVKLSSTTGLTAGPTSASTLLHQSVHQVTEGLARQRSAHRPMGDDAAASVSSSMKRSGGEVLADVSRRKARSATITSFPRARDPAPGW